MAETIGTLAGVRKESIARVELFTSADVAPDEWRLVITFETAGYDPSGQLIAGTQQFGSRQTRRKFASIKDAAVTAAGATVTVAQLAALIATAAYTFRAEDVAAEG